MKSNENLWAIILAAGEGVRLRSLTTNEKGVAVPKQFCSFLGGKSMLQCALERAKRIIPRERIITVVLPEHETWWKRELSLCSQENIVIQPKNRGTAAGILLPLVEILRRDPHAHVLVLPSDHYVEAEEILQKALEEAIEAAQWKNEKLVLLGIAPEEPDPEYGWIVPSPRKNGNLSDVARFVEKPRLSIAQHLQDQGALWNSFIFVAPGNLLLKLYLEHLPDLAHPFLGRLEAAPGKKWEEAELLRLYEGLSVVDFSRDLLERSVKHLAVLRVPLCGWSDLGTPARVVRCLTRVKKDPPKSGIAPWGTAPLDSELFGQSH